MFHILRHTLRNKMFHVLRHTLRNMGRDCLR